ncbi:MAG: NUDIX hydrolase [Candidatus Dormibacteria bacterium]
MLALVDPGSEELPLLLLVRSSQLSSHPGQVALPGGRPAPEDGPLWRTALREAQEELAVPEAAVRLRGRATVVETPNSGYAIHPFVATLGHPFTPKAAAAEVSEYFWFPLRPAAGGHPERRRMRTSRGWLEVAGWPYGQHFVWGATGAIVSDLRERLEG